MCENTDEINVYQHQKIAVCDNFFFVKKKKKINWKGRK
jgi:hypothetical protein